MLDERGTSAAIVEVDSKTGEKKAIYSTPDRLEHGHCDQTATRCLIKSSKPGSERNAFGGNDKTGLVFLDGSAASVLDVRSMTSSPEITAAPLSPDARFFVIKE